MPTSSRQKAAAVNDSAAVDAFMSVLEHPYKAELERLRSIIRDAHAGVCERIKWNAPSFFYHKDIGAFHPRERGFVHVVLVYPDGMEICDDDGILEGTWKDRRMLKLYSMDDIEDKRTAIETIVRDWVTRMDEIVRRST